MASAPDTGRRPGRPKKRFTPEVLDAITRWVGMGIDRRDIAEALGTTTGSLVQTCFREGIALSDGRTSALFLQRALPPASWERLRAAAASRNMTAIEMTIQLMRVIAGDDMFDAILDDMD